MHENLRQGGGKQQGWKRREISGAEQNFRKKIHKFLKKMLAISKKNTV